MSLYSQIPTVIERFDFNKVLKVMHFLEWNWFDGKVTFERLQSAALMLIGDAITGYEGSDNKEFGFVCASGGLEARIEPQLDHEPLLTLSFNLTKAEGYDL